MWDADHYHALFKIVKAHRLILSPMAPILE
jgi:hypothetical protein